LFSDGFSLSLLDSAGLRKEKIRKEATWTLMRKKANSQEKRNLPGSESYVHHKK
jgi:hypothetical protein